jgi:kynurenine formamidase
MADYSNLPDYDSLPKVKDMPKGCAWGLFDKDGKKDHLGCLNLLTPKVVQEAYKEARDGISVSLNWPIGAIRTPGFLRKGLVHKTIDFKDTPLNISGFDDEVEFNTQCSSQWDSLVHFHHQPTGTGYNGVKTTKEALTQDFGNLDLDKTLPTLNHWHERGGLVGRGVLLDYRAYAEAKGIQYSCFEAHAISTKTLDDIAAYQGTQFKHGDILIIRTGFTQDLGAASGDEQEKMLGTHSTIGVAGNEEAAKWHWNHHFSAVAGDAIAYEVTPPTLEDGSKGTIANLVLHQYFLSLFGLNIGELWDLQALGEHCKKIGRYSFLLTSIPLNVPGAVGSPPNALAIF